MNDTLELEIAALLREHPEIADRYVGVNLDALTSAAKQELLSGIKSTLGIRPIRSRHLGYVGPDEV